MDEQQQHGQHNRNDNAESFPDSLKCIVTDELVTDPCVVSKCVCSTHQREILEKWVREHGRCLSCNTPATLADIRANISTRHAIQHLAPAAYTAAVRNKISQALDSGNFTTLARIMNDNDVNAHLPREDIVGIQREAVRQLSEYLTMASSENKSRLAGSDCIPAILKVMRGHKDDAFLQKQGCAALCEAIKIISGDLQHDQAVDAVDVILDSMKENPGCSLVESSRLEALKELVNEHGAAINDQFADADGIPAVLATMKKHPKNPQLLSAALSVLWNVTCISEGDDDLHCDMIFEADGIPVILEAMQNHLERSKRLIQFYCVGVLQACSNCNSSYANSIFDSGGIPIIFAAVHTCLDYYLVRERGLRLLAELLQCGEAYELCPRHDEDDEDHAWDDLLNDSIYKL